MLSADTVCSRSVRQKLKWAVAAEEGRLVRVAVLGVGVGWQGRGLFSLLSPSPRPLPPTSVRKEPLSQRQREAWRAVPRTPHPHPHQPKDEDLDALPPCAHSTCSGRSETEPAHHGAYEGRSRALLGDSLAPSLPRAGTCHTKAGGTERACQ